MSGKFKQREGRRGGEREGERERERSKCDLRKKKTRM